MPHFLGKIGLYGPVGEKSEKMAFFAHYMHGFFWRMVFLFGCHAFDLVATLRPSNVSHSDLASMSTKSR